MSKGPGIFQPSNQSFSKKQQFSPAKPPTNRKIITHIQSPNKTTNVKAIDQNLFLQSGNRNPSQNLSKNQKGASNPNLYSNQQQSRINRSHERNKKQSAQQYNFSTIQNWGDDAGYIDSGASGKQKASLQKFKSYSKKQTTLNPKPKQLKKITDPAFKPNLANNYVNQDS